MVYTENTKDNLAVQNLVAGGKVRVDSSGAATLGIQSGQVRFTVSVESRTDTAAVLVRVVDSGDATDDCEVLLRCGSATITDEGGDRAATNMVGYSITGSRRYVWQDTLGTPVGEWVISVDTDGSTEATPIVLSGFQVEEIGIQGAGSISISDLDPALRSQPVGEYVAAEYYALSSQPSGFALSATALTADQTVLYPWVAPRDLTPAELGVYVTVVSAGATTTKILIYAHDETTGWPSDLIFEGDDLDTATGPAPLFVSQEDPGISFTAGTVYWIGLLSDGAPTLRSQTTVAASILNRLATVGATTMATHLILAGEDYADPTDPWVFAAAQLTAANNPIVIALV